MPRTYRGGADKEETGLTMAQDLRPLDMTREGLVTVYLHLRESLSQEDVSQEEYLQLQEAVQAVSSEIQRRGITLTTEELLALS